MSSPRLLNLATACLSLSAFVSAGEPTLEQRIEKLEETLEAAREDAHVPGMSIAIVKDDEVVWARGFGLADVAAERPADAETIYAIGSTTKAFTATLVGVLADEGKADWDDPVIDYLPFFDLDVRSDDDLAECTLRDLLSHRHGFARMSILWMGGKLTREEILRTAAGAEPFDDFRAGFHYCNVAYLAAGEAAGVAAESSWDGLMQERLLGPLGMDSSTLSTRAAKEDPRLALGYSWDEADGRFEHEEMIELDRIGPAGSVNSNVLDMAQWVRLQLGRGAIDGTRLISEERLLETWTPQIEIGNGVSYGLGWMLREHDGRKVVEHGGNINGFSAQIGMIPEEDLGYVLLMNLDASPLQQASLPLVFDALLDDWPAEGAVASAEVELDDYVGVYVANFATFEDEEFEVAIKDETLTLDIPSQQVFELRLPGDDGRWSFALTDQIAVSFQRDSTGRVVSLTVHQGGYDFEVPRDGVAAANETSAEELEKYAGAYVLAEGEKRIEITIARGRLVLNDRGKRMDFRAPDADGFAALRARPDHGAEFTFDDDGRVDGLLFRGQAGERRFDRVQTEAAEDLPTVAELLELRGTTARVAAIEAGGGTESTGTVWVAQAGVRGTITVNTLGADRFASRMDFGQLGRIEVIADRERAWRYNPITGLEELKGKELAQAMLEHPGAVEGDWREHFDSIEVVRGEEVADRAAWLVRLEKADLPSRSYWVDAVTGDVLRAKMTVLERSIRVPVTITFSEFAERDGIRDARRVELENPMTGRTVLTFERSASGLDLPDDTFRPSEAEPRD